MNYEKFLKLLIESTQLFEIQDSVVIDKSENKPFLIKDKKVILPKKVIKNINDVFVVNPFHETIDVNICSKWLYNTLSMSVAYKIQQLLTWVVQYSSSDKLGNSAAKFVSKYCKHIDTKTSKEVERLTKDLIKVSSIYYAKRTKTAYFRLSILEEIHSSNIRTTTKKWMRQLLKDIFELDNFDLDDIKESFKYRSTKITYPKFDGFCNVYLKVLTCFNDVFDKLEVDEFIVDIEEFGRHIIKFDEYYKKLKWMTQPIEITKEQQPSSTLPPPEPEPNYLDTLLSPYKQAAQNNTFYLAGTAPCQAQPNLNSQLNNNLRPFGGLQNSNQFQRNVNPWQEDLIPF
jgi:hypothetical protein